MTFHRVLIFGQPFNDFSGGGITLTNLFKGWPSDKIAVAFLGHGLFNVTTDICKVYYQLGREEHKWIFPFNLIQRKFESGLKDFKKSGEFTVNHIQKGLRYRLVNSLFYPFLRWIGVFHFASRLSVSESFRNWLIEFKPEILYLQVSTREEIHFANELIDFQDWPSVIHIMDDWPSTIINKGPFRKFWERKIDGELKSLLEKINLHLSISDAMSAEYLKRYGKTFLPFHNPIEIDSWLIHSKKEFSLSNDNIRILYSGRLGIGITESVVEVASVLESLNADGYKIKFHIQTPTKEPKILSRLKKFNTVIINPFADLKDIPKIFSNADILVLANDFSNEGLKYLKFSMPTKASEYMISGTPILVYSPEETAVSRFFIQNECGLVVSRHDHEALLEAFRFIIDNKEYQEKISRNAVRFAMEKFDAGKVRNEFQNLINHLSNNSKNVL
ncbi:MAG: glycosyltransferase [Bacteroidales bacterium]|nr:glycosyltransferase [Bacteroidales bacterium]